MGYHFGELCQAFKTDELLVLPVAPGTMGYLIVSGIVVMRPAKAG